MGTEIRLQAEKLRLEGWSYSIISQKLSIPKSTLSLWLRNLPYRPNDEVTQRIKNGPLKSAFLRNQNKLASIESIYHKASEDIGKLSQRDLMMLGIGLYIGEGSKLYEQVRLINSDPEVIRLSINWFKQVCGLDDNNFRPKVHIYPDCDEIDSLNYWSKSIGISKEYFSKVYIDRRENKKKVMIGKLPYGTLHLYIVSNGNPLKGVVLHRKILGWIEHIYKQMRV